MGSKLNIKIKENVSANVAANAEAWIEDICNWLLAQPRPADMEHTQPRYTEIDFTVADAGHSRGLRSKDTGAGWAVLSTGTDLKIEDRPKLLVFPTTEEIACRGNWCFLISQLNRPEGYYKDSFRWQEHTNFQLRYLDRLAASNRSIGSLLEEYKNQKAEAEAAEREAAYRRQYPEKRKLRQARQAEAWRIKVPSWWYDRYPEERPDDYVPAKSDRRQPVYGEPPAPQPPLPPQQPKQHPTPQLSPQDARALEIIERQQQYMASYCGTEDGDM